MSYNESLEDVDKVLLKWLNAIGEFCHRCDHLNHIIRSTSSSRKPTQRAMKLRKLLLLREQLRNTMSTLLTDMNPSFHSTVSLSSYSKLQVHTSLLDELNQKIDDELAFTS